MTPITLVKFIILSLAMIWGFVVVALDADVLATEQEYVLDTVTLDFQSLGIATGLFTIVILLPLSHHIVSRGNSTIVSGSELILLGALTILWAVESALITLRASPIGFRCDAALRSLSLVSSICADLTESRLWPQPPSFNVFKACCHASTIVSDVDYT
ncbi:hypothetical protein VNI00_014089 [Paramarasmius palmivorus]|uniref:Uncharacterized protein n=1 Tax=Paramarasmius palmivorus TaxID=297713 RepID=A0AAW0BUI5_9AGAR